MKVSSTPSEQAQKSRDPFRTGTNPHKPFKTGVKLVDIRLPLTTSVKNIDQEFYWEEKCEKQEFEGGYAQSRGAKQKPQKPARKAVDHHENIVA